MGRKQRLRSLRLQRRLQKKRRKKRPKNKVFNSTKQQIQSSKTSWCSYLHYNKKSGTPKNNKTAEIHSIQKSIFNTLQICADTFTYGKSTRLLGAIKSHDFFM